MFIKFASASLALTALTGLVMISVFGIWMAAKLSGADLPLPPAPTDRGSASTASAGGSAPAVMPPNQDGLSFTDRYFLDRMQLERTAPLDITLSETDEISVYWRLRQKNRFKPDGSFKALSEPPNTPMMAPLNLDYIYCPAWFSRWQLMPPQGESSPLKRFEPAIMYIRHLGERIGFYEGSCQGERSKDRGRRVINRICLNYPDPEQGWLLYEFTTAQENGRLQSKMKRGETESLVCRLRRGCSWCRLDLGHENGGYPAFYSSSYEDWLQSIALPFKVDTN